METFTKPKKLIRNPDYPHNKVEQISKIRSPKVDLPLRKFICTFNRIPHAFTLQCCWGHFLPKNQEKPVKMDELPESYELEKVLYQIAYIAFCVQHCNEGKQFLKRLEQTVSLNPLFIQFGSASWFWQRQVNSFVLQVMPDRFKLHDRIVLDYEEALQIQKWRSVFFNHLNQKIDSESSSDHEGKKHRNKNSL